MKKLSYLKSIFLLCLLWAGIGCVCAQEQGQFAWHKVTSLSDVKTGDLVLLVDESNNIALSNNGSNNVFTGASVTISNYKIADDVSDDMKWTLTKNDDGSFTFKKGDKPLYGVSSPDMLAMIKGDYSTSQFYFDGYDSGGKLYYEDQANFQYRYVYWNGDQPGITNNANAAKLTLYKRGVEKWKLVDGEDITITDGDIVVVADLASGMAMSNDKEDNDPDAVDVDTLFNDDKDRLLGEIPEKIKWIYKTATDGFQLATGENKLYADSKGLKVGTKTPNVFDIYSYTETDEQNNSTTTDYLHIKLSDKDYLAGVEESMFSNSWKLKEVKNDKPDNAVKNTRYAFFKRVVDEKKVITLKYKYSTFEVNEEKFNTSIIFASPEAEGADMNDIIQHLAYTSSNDEIATVAYNGAVKPLKMGMVKIVVRLSESNEYDKATASYTLRIDDSSKWGSRAKPFKPSQAKTLAENGTIEINGETVTLDPDCCYFVEGVVNKVNSGLMAMFGDMGLDEMMGEGFDMEEMMGDMDDFDMSEMGDMMGGMDMASMIPGMGSSEGLTYYVSDDGTKDDRLKVVNGRGLAKAGGAANSVVPDELKDLSPGDEVLVYGPLVSSEDNNMFSSLMGGGGNDEPKKTAKIDELNYLHKLDMTLLVQNQHTYTAYEKKLPTDQDFFYTLASGKPAANGEPISAEKIKPAQIKSADEEIAKWVKNEEGTDSTFTAVNPGMTKITVKIKVVLQEKDPNDSDSKEKSYTMKRKFQLEVLPRDKEPEGMNVGEYVLAKTKNELEYNYDIFKRQNSSLRMIIVGTRTKDSDEGTETTHYTQGTDNSMMGGGKSGKKVADGKIAPNANNKDCIKYNDLPKNTQEIILEQIDGYNSENKPYWYLNVGKNENGEKLYLYASNKAKKETTEETNENTGQGNTGGFNMDEMMEMFNPSAGLKVGTKAEAVGEVDSCKVSITFNNDIATIKFCEVPDDLQNTIVLTSSFDMESMMGMFEGMGGNKEEGEDPEEPAEEESTFNMGSFDMFMASFNTKKPEDIDNEKAMLPRIFVFKQYDEYPVEIGDAEWKTIVSDYDAEPTDGNLDVYVVTSVERGDGQSKAMLQKVDQLKSGEPYLLHSSKGTYNLKRITFYPAPGIPAPEVNLLEVSDSETEGVKGSTSVYVLSKKSKGVGFYKWTGGKLGAGRVYLPVEANVEGANEFCAFFEDTTDAIQAIESAEQLVGPYYDLQGRRVEKPTKGVYIVNGQKVIIK
ncbi:MAG: hypothetical protein IKH86_06570 [Prevotella sp.]|nr:hypothetical protein [Prevotella sp.]